MFQETPSPSTDAPVAEAHDPLAQAHDRLGRLIQRFGDRITLVSALGPQSLLVLDLLAEQGHRPQVAFLDTAAHFRETYALLEEVERRYGLTIRRVRAESMTPEHWAQDPTACCAARKVEPLRRFLVPFDAWITGIRADQTAERADARWLSWDHAYGLWKANPLVAWSRPQVIAQLAARGVPTHPLLTQGYASIGCAPCTAPSSDERAGRFVGQGRRECGIHLSTTTTPRSLLRS